MYQKELERVKVLKYESLWNRQEPLSRRRFTMTGEGKQDINPDQSCDAQSENIVNQSDLQLSV